MEKRQGLSEHSGLGGAFPAGCGVRAATRTPTWTDGQCSPSKGWNAAVFVLLGVLLVSGLPVLTGGLSPVGAPASSIVSALGSQLQERSRLTTSGAESAAGHGLQPGWHQLAGQASTPTTASLAFFQNNSTFTNLPYSEQGCTYNYSSSYESTYLCQAQAEDPSAVTLANGDIGVAYTLFTNVTGTGASACVSGATNSTVRERVGFSRSANDGKNFGSIEFLGNETCAYLDAIEPSFAVGAGGTVYGTYVEENFSGNAGRYTDPDPAGAVCTYTFCLGAPGLLATSTRSADALAFTSSSNNGASFDAPVTLNSSGWIAHPQIATFGDSVYILYEYINNETPTGGYFYYGQNDSTYWDESTAIRLELLYSANGGASWNGPYGVPGLAGASGLAQEAGGSLAVNASGTVVVAYFTNDHCDLSPAIYGGTCWAEVDDLVFSTSTRNGSSFSGPNTVSSDWGSIDRNTYYDYYLKNGYASNFELLPQSSVAISPQGETLYIGWTAAYNQSALFDVPLQSDNLPYEDESGAFEATGPISGGGFTTSILSASPILASGQYAFSLSLAANRGGEYATYTEINTTYDAGNCNSPPCDYTSDTYYQAIQTSPNGLNWTQPGYSTFVWDQANQYNFEASYPGYYSSVAFTPSGAPIYVYALPGAPTNVSYDYSASPFLYSATFPTELYAATNYSGPTVTLNVAERGLNDTAWSISIAGSSIQVPAGTTNFSVGGVAANQTVLLETPQLPLAYGEIAVGSINVTGGRSWMGSAASFTANGSVLINETTEYALNFSWEPTDLASFELWNRFYSREGYSIYYNAIWCSPACNQASSPLPWYFPKGETLEWYAESYIDSNVDLWTGTGNGSYSGSGGTAGDLNVTMDGVINETAWFVPIEYYNVTVTAPALPSSTHYSFEFDGAWYNGTAPSGVVVPHVETGVHSLENLSAPAASPGWTYIGTRQDLNPVLVPNELTLNLTFALVNTSAALGNVSFRAEGFTPGIPWQLQFNQTNYSSQTPWINITTRPGVFQLQAFAAVAPNGSIGFVPTSVTGTVSVQTSASYQINYTPAFKVTTLWATGGSVSGGGHGGIQWVAPGASVDLHASAYSGWIFLGWTGSGPGSYTGTSEYANLSSVDGPVVEGAGFAPLPTARFNLTFDENGLPPGTLWTADVGGLGYSAASEEIVVQNLLACGSAGSFYNVSIPDVNLPSETVRYVPSTPIPAKDCTTGSTVITETFAAQYYVSVQSTEGGYATVSCGPNATSNGTWVPANGSVTLTAIAASGESFVLWEGSGTGNYTGPELEPTIQISGSVIEVATFAPTRSPTPATYSLEFNLPNPLPSSTPWTVQVGATGYSSTSAVLLLSNLTAAVYSISYSIDYASDGLSRYTLSGGPSSVDLTANRSIELSYSQQVWFTVSAGVGGVVVSPIPAAQWLTNGTVLRLNASATAGFSFSDWTGTAYSGTQDVVQISVTSPGSEVAWFQPELPAAKSGQTNVSPSFGGLPFALLPLGAIALIGGLIAAFVLSRRRPNEEPNPSRATGGTDTPNVEDSK